MKRKTKRKMGFGIFCILLVIVAFVLIRPLGDFEVLGTIRNFSIFGDSNTGYTPANEDTLPDEADGRLNFENALSYTDVGFSLSSNQALLINLTTREVLFDYNAHARVYPASLTKIMTVLLGVTQGQGETMTVQADFDQLMLNNASVAGFSSGEVRSTSEILHGAMLPSGADATSTIAHHVGGTYDRFVDLMNEKARDLGMENTHFMNTSGLHHPNHYTTPYDMAILLRYALENPIFRTVFTTRDYSFINWLGERQYMQSTLFFNLSSTEFPGGEIIGGRTGFTNEAGRCLASLATNGIDEFVLITFGADVYSADYQAHFADAFTIYGYFLQQNR